MIASHESVAYFDALYAGNELDWIDQAWVMPDLYPRILGNRSVIVIGERGTGKSVLAHTLLRQAREESACGPLVVAWRPVRAGLNAGDEWTMEKKLAQILQECAIATLHFVGEHVSLFQNSPQWAQHFLTWFIHRHGKSSLEFELSRLRSTVSPDVYRLLNHLVKDRPKPIYSDDTPEQRILHVLAQAIDAMNATGLWIVIDGLETWESAQETEVEQAIGALLSSLSLFEIPSFAIKLFVPNALAPQLLTHGSIFRRRVDVEELTWDEAGLRKVVERRLALATKQSAFHLNDLADEDRVLEHLRSYGGLTPRGWLDMLRPFFEHFMIMNSRKPLSVNELDSIVKRKPPRIHLVEETNTVYIGYRTLDSLPPQPAKVLAYLYKNSNRVCTSEELYYRALQGLSHVPLAGDDSYVEEDAWKSSFENVILHLRRRIEPYKSARTYVVNIRNRGYRLNHVW